jgi:2'-5' RNA ligase
MSSPRSATLFLALWPGAGELGQMLAWQKSRDFAASARLTPPQKIHVTLHFLGRVPYERIPELIEKLEVPAPAVRIVFDRLELWGRGLAVMTAASLPPELQSLQDALGERLLALGVPVESRAYRPHVTLARDAGRLLPPEPQGGSLPPVEWRSTGYVLVESRGGRYTRVAAYRLGGG